jgi:hypothetical protein
MYKQVHNISFPISEPHALGQDEAFFILKEDGHEVRIRFHDYDKIYDRPGLYEQLFYQRLHCASPRKVRDLLEKVLQDNRVELNELRVLDLGAGNGMVGELLDAARVIGVDISESARKACERDRPDAYDAYYVADMSRLDASTQTEMKSWQLDAPAPARVAAEVDHRGRLHRAGPGIHHGLQIVASKRSRMSLGSFIGSVSPGRDQRGGQQRLAQLAPAAPASPVVGHAQADGAARGVRQPARHFLGGLQDEGVGPGRAQLEQAVLAVVDPRVAGQFATGRGTAASGGACRPRRGCGAASSAAALSSRWQTSA